MNRKSALHICIGLLLAVCGGWMMYLICQYGLYILRWLFTLETDIDRYQLLGTVLLDLDHWVLQVICMILLLWALVRKRSGRWIIFAGILLTYLYLQPILQTWYEYRLMNLMSLGTADDLFSLVNTLSPPEEPNWLPRFIMLLPGLLVMASGLHWRRFLAIHSREIPEKWPFFKTGPISMPEEEAVQGEASTEDKTESGET